MNNNVLKFINVLESWKTAIKNLHWSANSLSQHQLCDDIASEIAEFQDTVSEVEQGINGKIGLNKLNPTHYTIKSLKQFIQDIISETTSFYKGLKGDTYIGMRSDCESFLSTMQKHLYLVNFTLKEDLKRRMQALNENKYIVIEGKNGSVKMTDKQFKSFLTEEIEKRLFVNEIHGWDTDALQRDYDRAKEAEEKSFEETPDDDYHSNMDIEDMALWDDQRSDTNKKSEMDQMWKERNGEDEFSQLCKNLQVDYAWTEYDKMKKKQETNDEQDFQQVLKSADKSPLHRKGSLNRETLNEKRRLLKEDQWQSYAMRYKELMQQYNDLCNQTNNLTTATPQQVQQAQSLYKTAQVMNRKMKSAAGEYTSGDYDDNGYFTSAYSSMFFNGQNEPHNMTMTDTHGNAVVANADEPERIQTYGAFNTRHSNPEILQNFKRGTQSLRDYASGASDKRLKQKRLQLGNKGQY